MNTKTKAILLATLGCLGTSVAHAHRQWILPGLTVLSGENQWVSVEAATSNNLFFPNHRPVQLASLEVIGPDGAPVPLHNANVGNIRTTFELLLQKEGTYVISTRPAAAGGRGAAPAPAPVAKAADDDHDAPAPVAAAAPAGRGGRGGVPGGLSGTWTENGQVQRWTGTPATLVSENMAAKPGFKLTAAGGRSVKTYITLGKPSRETIKPTGKDLEVDFVTHPNDLVTGEKATFRFLVDGKPAAGAVVTVIRGDDRFRNSEEPLNLTAGADGIVKIDWPQAGRYWLQATGVSKGEMHGVPLEKTSTYVGVFEVLPE